MEYRIITTETWVKAFVSEVNQAIAEGWEPLGGVCVQHLPLDSDAIDEQKRSMGFTIAEYKTVYTQAMVKYDRSENVVELGNIELNDLDGRIVQVLSDILRQVAEN